MANPPDPSNVVLLCHFNGADGDTTTNDLSPSAHAISRIALGGPIQITSEQARFCSTSTTSNGADWSCWLITGAGTDWQFGNGPFTVEAWVYFTHAPGAEILSVLSQWHGTAGLGWFFGMGLGNLAFYYSTTGTDNPYVGAAWTPALNTWHHIAADRDASNVLRVYVNGAVLASATVASTFYNSTANLDIAGSDTALFRWPGITGYVDEVRIVKGEAVYGGAFTRPTAAFAPDDCTDVDTGGVYAYPATLPGPIRAPIKSAERRLLSGLPGPRQSRAIARDRLAKQTLEFAFTFEQMVVFNAWLATIGEGGAWFSASWPQPQGGVGLRRFIGAPSYPYYMPNAGWHVTVECEVKVASAPSPASPAPPAPPPPPLPPASPMVTSQYDESMAVGVPTLVSGALT